ncbi:MerR family transcriptional regulator [Sphaerisporangium siamense]|uniref:DNA-binding transcriptional MerR regulator n=1 Tax=Sphaerisporangium siamense TaxID=795645 RepID=A0A7W7GDK4_9ACTN|nr:MerR family transcriptional regulator [Sphaerisporangium siamense]MBB4705697.1 DNA-binding transcriptional MerR regulator [Sphaerisporangium siamense]GII82917.1 MerR family transcriptional regulator [Sphaerisporangium siamense]
MSGERAEEGPSYGIGAVARRLGVPAPTLRTWNARYGIGPSRRSAGGHRRYDTGDLLRLEEMNRLVKAGMPPSEAAQLALGARPEAAASSLAAPSRTDGPPAVEGAPAAPGRPSRERPDRQGAAPSAVTLARAALNLDVQAVAQGLEAALDGHGVAWTWERLALPVFDAIMRRQAGTGAGVEIEHMFSERLLSALSHRTGRPAGPAHPRPILLACAQDEQHSLPVYALAATLTTTLALETRVLGPRTPHAALGDAMRRLGPLAVFVWSQLRETGDPAPLGTLPALRPASRVLVGGPGWWPGLPAGVTHVRSLREAVAEVHATLG